MRLLVDECTGPAVARWLRGRGHDVFSVYEEARGMDDVSVLAKAAAEQRVLITNDKDLESGCSASAARTAASCCFGSRTNGRLRRSPRWSVSSIVTATGSPTDSP